MRKELCNTLCNIAQDPSMVFFTGDLGFMALEPLQSKMGNRFINAGLSEQNMVSVAAAMAKDGWSAWCYSIASFCFARPFEQIRNDVCMHDLPVKLIGNGGGYGYGVMGPSHHAIEDYAVMLSLPFMKVFVPCFNEDVGPTILAAKAWNHPCYIRLGLGELPIGETYPTYRPWRKLLEGAGPVIIATGTIGGSAWSTLKDLPQENRPDLWILSELPIINSSFPEELIKKLSSGATLITIEEHISHGGLNSMVAQKLLLDGIRVSKFISMNSVGLATGVYGSQQFLRKHSKQGPDDIKEIVLHAHNKG